MIYDKVISLGPSCETAWQIRQIVDQPEAYVFDWVIASAASVADAIRTDFAGIVRPERLSLQDHGVDHPYILDAATGIEYHHDFKNDEHFLQSLPDVQQKYDHLIGRMRRLLSADARILFVHQKGTFEEAKLLEAAVARRFAALQFTLLEIAVGSGKSAISRDGRLAFVGIEGKGSTWQEREPEWAEVFDALLGESFGRTLKRRESAPCGMS